MSVSRTANRLQSATFGFVAEVKLVETQWGWGLSYQ
jgi:hypothetical protein